MKPLYAGIDLGGTTIGGILADASGRIVEQASITTESHAGPAAVLERIAQLVERMIHAAKVRVSARVEAVGIGCPGLVDVAHGVTKFFPNLPTQWRDVPVAEILAKRLDCPVSLLNDVRAATLGELTFGYGRNVKTMAFFSLGTGVGGGLVIDGKLRLGPLGAAGELGHQTIVPDGPLCGCGNRGCLEALASGPAIAAEGVRLMLGGQAPKLYEMTAGNPSLVTTRTLAEAAQAGDAGAAEAISRATEYLGIGIANVVSCLHPQLIVVGGGVAEMGELLLAPLRRIVRERVRMFPPDDVRIERSLLGVHAGALGAVALALHGAENL
ncbi:MAG: ROK family protein [Planctomycetia bacterium]|nr:ROK family protein [Planctomycetia bacterium]